MICPQCRLDHCHDCLEASCPGPSGFVPSSWQRPLLQLTQEHARYEALILQLADMFFKPGAVSDAQLYQQLDQYAQAIRARSNPTVSISSSSCA